MKESFIYVRTFQMGEYQAEKRRERRNPREDYDEDWP
jgi:hypothetical protein